MSKVELSRRGFLKSTLAATGAAMAGTAAHAGDIPEKWQQPKCSGWSWEKPAPKIAPEQIKKTVNTDVVVIGAGLAGFAAALAAAQEGAKVVLVEKTRGWSCRGGHITAFNSSLQKKMVSILMPPKSSAVWWHGAKAEWMNACFGCLPESAVTAWIGPLTLPANTTPM